MTTLESHVDSVSETLDGMERRSTQPNEWASINDMRLTVMELKGQLHRFREIEVQNENMKRRTS